jgi:hypothetical protein
MFKAEQYRAKATVFDELIKRSNDPKEIRNFQDSKSSFNCLAENEEWLANNFDKTIQAPTEERLGDIALAEEEEHVLRCLGASVIMQWNAIPTKLQRELFDTAGSMGEVLDTAELRGQIARFLHKHKDDDTGASDE